MNHAVRVDVVEALCDVDQLMGVEGKFREAERKAHKGDQILMWVRFDVSRQISVGHPL